jgi:3-phenylpropionate/cinnamic acid dioxygenase small subunit
MIDLQTKLAATEFLYEEARALDTMDWPRWLAMYDENAIFWTPTWKDDGEPTSDPETELSLIYCSSRSQLEERTSRVSGGRTLTSMPPLRTAHSVSNVIVRAGDDGYLDTSSVVTTHVFNVKKRDQMVFFSLQEHVLENRDTGFVIRSKKALLLNDYIPRMLDFYMI